MNGLRTVAQEVLGLFVDSGAFAAAILAWLAAVGVAVSWLGLAPSYAGVILFAGLAVLLLAGVAWGARQ